MSDPDQREREQFVDRGASRSRSQGAIPEPNYGANRIRQSAHPLVPRMHTAVQIATTESAPVRTSGRDISR